MIVTWCWHVHTIDLLYEAAITVTLLSCPPSSLQSASKSWVCVWTEIPGCYPRVIKPYLHSLTVQVFICTQHWGRNDRNLSRVLELWPSWWLHMVYLCTSQEEGSERQLFTDILEETALIREERKKSSTVLLHSIDLFCNSLKYRHIYFFFFYIHYKDRMCF